MHIASRYQGSHDIWPKATALMDSMPACSLKALHTNLQANSTTHSTSHGRAFNRAEERGRRRMWRGHAGSITGDLLPKAW